MAYLDLAASHPFETADWLDLPTEPKLSSQERLVILLSRRDPVGSLRPPRSYSRLVRFLFGIDPPHRLADTRLEALRRYAVTYRLRHPDAQRVEAAAIDAGFADRQLAQVRQMLEHARLPQRRGAGAFLCQSLLVLDFVLGFYCATAWLSARLGSVLVAFVIAAVAVVSFAPVLAEPHLSRRPGRG
ncbi:MAG TPA: hypothetical protein VNT42_06560 [Sphingomonas sp.]|nr:hypothetical protein [Sphingomonas sp.]